MDSDKRIRVLFICTGNACRSQIAEGWARELRGDTIEAYSAGVRPIGVSPKAIEIMAEADVDISAHRSKHIDELSDIDFDYVVTLCDSAAQSCPVFPGKAKVIHKPFTDPYFACGTEKEVMTVFRKIRDEIRSFIETMPKSLENLP